jgi:SAM-dependent methyltransferase
LEIGSGIGDLGHLFVSGGAFYTGIEPYGFFYEAMSSHYGDLKDRVFNCQLGAAALKKDYFDFIVLVDTLEHVPDPLGLLEEVKEHLKKNGKIYVEVPNERWYFAKNWARKLFRLPCDCLTNPDHVNYFTNRSLRNLMNRLFLDSRFSYVPIYSDCERMRLVLNDRYPAAWLISSFFKLTKLDVLFRLGNIVCVAGPSSIEKK